MPGSSPSAAAAEVFLVEQPKASKFTLEQWQSIWGGRKLTPAQCSSDDCLLGSILFASTPVTDCRGAKLLLSPVPQPGCTGITVLDAALADTGRGRCRLG